MTDILKTAREALKLSEKATPGPWAHRKKEYGNWILGRDGQGPTVLANAIDSYSAEETAVNLWNKDPQKPAPRNEEEK